MTKFDFDEILERRHLGSLKYDAVADDVLPLWVADMDFRVAPAITRALSGAVSRGVFGYARPPAGWHQAIIGWHLRRNGQRIEKDWIIPVPGTGPALSAVIQALALPGDQVIVQSPVYNCFFPIIKNSGAEVVANRLYQDEAGRWRIDFADLEEKLAASRARLFLLCNPQNPCGRLWRTDELQTLAELCRKYRRICVSDEIHCDIRPSGSVFHSMGEYADILEDKLIILRSPSKPFNIAGLQNAYAVIREPAIRERISTQISINEIHELNALGYFAAIAAYNESEDWLSAMNEYVHGNFLLLKSFTGANLPQLRLTELEATYLAWLDCRALGLSSRDLTCRLHHQAKVLFSSGDAYGDGGEGFIRVNLACPKSVLKEALERIKPVMLALA